MTRIPVALFLFFTSCISIPQQAPQLSEELGKRISSLEKSHISLLHSYFDEKRNSIDDFMESTWVPEFAMTFFNKSEIQEAWQQIVESKDTNERLDFIVAVGPQLQVIINEKRQELVVPLNDLESELELAIREEYNLSRSMNNTLTSFLTSAAKVKENQQRYLDMLKITDDKVAMAINETDRVLANLLDQAQKVLEGKDKIREYSAQAEQYKQRLQEILDKFKK